MKIAFVCIHNSCRSQMAEGWAKALAPKEFEVYSAGTEDYPEVKPLAKKAMEEVGINMDDHHPKLLKDIPNSLDVLITMGCGVECPYVPARFRQDWGLEDPSGGPYEGFQNTRDIIKSQVELLLEAIEDGSIWDKKSVDLNLK
jgi:arsenate reductase